MACSQASAIFSVKVFVEENVVPPIRISLELFGASIHRTSAGFVSQEDSRQTVGDLSSYLEQVHHIAFLFVTVGQLRLLHSKDMITPRRQVQVQPRGNQLASITVVDCRAHEIA